MKPRIYIDFEYNNQSLVSCALNEEVYWLYNNPNEQLKLKNRLISIAKSHDIVCYQAGAEADSFIRLGLNPINFSWVDCFYLWKQLKNCNDNYEYGDVLDNKGKPIPFKTRRANKYLDEIYEDEERGIKKKEHISAGNSLADCVYGITKELIDTEHKTRIRDIIISNAAIEEHKQAILDYNISDLKYLPIITDYMLNILLGEYKCSNPAHFEHTLLTMKDVYHHSRFVAELAIVAANGIPLRVDNIKYLSEKYQEIDNSLCEGFNSRHTKYQLFEPNKPVKSRKLDYVYIKQYTEKQKVYQQFIEDLNIPDFPKTSSGQYTGEEKKLKSYDSFPFCLDYRRTKKARKAIGKYTPESLPKFLERVSDDGRLHCFFNPYGTQTGRNAPPATHFIFAQSHWLRSMVCPPEGKVILAADWKSQEFMISAYMSGDTEMKAAYESGDVYVAFGEKVGLIKGKYDENNSSHQDARNICKTVVLGIGYGMQAKSLAMNIKKPVEYAQELIDSYYNIYHVYADWKNMIRKAYKEKHLIRSTDNWLLGRDNPVMTSVLNFPVQATGAACLRYALHECLNNGLNVIATLHDAIYFEAFDNKHLEDTKDRIKYHMSKGVEKALDVNHKVPVDISVHRANEIWIEKKGYDQFEAAAHYCNFDDMQLTKALEKIKTKRAEEKAKKK